MTTLKQVVFLTMFVVLTAIGCAPDEGTPGSDKSKTGAVGSYYNDTLTITCDRTANALDVTVVGPLQEGISPPLTSDTIYLEYGWDGDGWTGYAGGGKARTLYQGDWIEGYSGGYYSQPRTYKISLPRNADNFNLFLYRQSTGTVGWFQLDSWTVKGSCSHAAGAGGIRQTTSGGGGGNGSGTAGTISCTSGSALSVAIYGSNFIAGVFDGAPTNGNVRLEYGSNPGSWTSYVDGPKSQAYWYPSQQNYTLSLPSNVTSFNFFLYDTVTHDQRWFDLSKWSVTGDCQLASDGKSIVRYGSSGTPPVSGLSITCEPSGSDLTYIIRGYIPDGLISALPNCGGQQMLLEYGSATDGYTTYTSGKPYGYLQTGVSETRLILRSQVQAVNFFVWCQQNQQVVWFDLKKWSYGGSCYRNADQDIRH